MAKRQQPKVRGVYEHPKGSDVWWIQYFKDGIRRRESIGRRGDAIAAYQDRKVAIKRGLKLPDLKRGQVTLSALIDDVLEFAKAHNARPRDYESKAGIVRDVFGTRIASSIKPQEIDSWLAKNFKTPATMNRYRAFLSLVYKQANINGKIDVNPARLVRQRKEPPGRIRFLSYQEYFTLHSVISKRFPEHLAEFVVSVHTGMRLTEQYTVTWDQVSFERKVIELTKTKNGSRRTVHLDDEALVAIESMKQSGQKRTDLVFPNGTADFVTKSWFYPCLEEAGIAGYVWHCNRHTFCSWLAMNGATLKEIQTAAGHKTISMSAKYSHLSPTHNEGVVGRLSRALKNAATATV